MSCGKAVVVCNRNQPANRDAIRLLLASEFAPCGFPKKVRQRTAQHLRRTGSQRVRPLPPHRCPQRSLTRQWLRLVNGKALVLSALLAALQFSWFWRVLQMPSAATQITIRTANPPHQLRVWAAFVLCTVALLLAIAHWNASRLRKPHSLLPTEKSLLIPLALLLLALPLTAHQPSTTSPLTLPATHFVEVARNVHLEVLDWGGQGVPLILLAGSGFDAHTFDHFAPQFAKQHRVLAITRRGFGKSSAPLPTADNYSADRLGEDISVVIAALRLARPVLIGHSLAGEEMSAITAHHPQQVRGLVYLDAAYSYAYYTPAIGDPIIDAADLNARLNSFLSTGFEQTNTLEDVQKASAQLDRDLQSLIRQRALLPAQPPRPANAPTPQPIPLALSKGRRKYTHIAVPVLAIFAIPHAFGSLCSNDPKAKAAVIENDRATTSAQADAFERGIPTARVIGIPNAEHFVFQSNEAEVTRAINAFLETLP